jgi:replicative DNA helicase
MSRRELVERLALSRARVPSDRWRSQRLGREDVERLVRAANELDALPVRVDDTPILGLRHLRARGRRLRAEAARAGAPLGLVIVDYLQLMAPERRGREVNRVQEVSEISRGLKVLARELEVAVLGISQLSRRCEERIDKRPHLADLRDSGSLEQDADVVLLLYRDDYYNPESESPGICEVNVAKQRNGPTGVVELAWVGEFARFRSLHRRP